MSDFKVPKLGYVPALDGIRAIAIGLVVAFHATGWPYGGPYGVDLFFVLSGFLITTMLVEERDRDGTLSLRRFYVGRARRLFPAVAVMLAVYLLYGAVRGANLLPDVADYGLYYGNIYFVVSHYRDPTGLSHLWSLAEEEQFYLVWPFLLLLIGRARRPLVWMLGLVVVAASWRFSMIAHGASMNRLYRAPDTHAEGLMLGCALAFVRRAGYQGKEWHGKLGVALVALAVILGNWKVFLPVVEAGSALLLVAATAETDLARMLSVRPLVWLGKRSYSLYVWHFPILWAFGQYGTLPCVAGAVAAAALSYRYVERPFRRRRNHRVVALEPVPSTSAG
jgi:peptidoglycan/LPS O-acetylase OafA/YrhL